MMDTQGGSPQGHLISLSEWIALAASLEIQQAETSRREAQLAYVGRAAITALLLVDALVVEEDENNNIDSKGENESPIASCCAFPAQDVIADNFSLEISVPGQEQFDIKELKQAPQLLLSTLNNIPEIHITKKSSSASNGTYVKEEDSLSEVLRMVGILLYQLFSRGKPPPSSVWLENNGNSEYNELSQGKKPSSEDGDGDDEYQELPGAEKGRQKRSIRDTCKSLRRVHISDLDSSLSEISLPESISILLKDLIEPGDKNELSEFQSLEDVSAELRQIVDQPNVFLYGQDTSQNGMLDFGGNIVGRTEEISCILEAAARTEVGEDEPNTLILIGGDSGCGKSYLVESVRGTLTENGWIYLSCKFDRLMRSQPLSSIASSFEKFFDHIANLANDGEVVGDVGVLLASIHESLSASGIVVLSELIPSLVTLYPMIFASIVEDVSESSSEDEKHEGRASNDTTNNDTHDSQIDGDDIIVSSAGTLKNRLHYLFRRLVQAISSPASPVLLWADDMQWIDESSIQLLSSLLTDSDHLTNENGNSCLLVICSYRDGEDDSSIILEKYLSKFDQSASVEVLKMHLDVMPIADANVLISEALRLSARRTRELTQVLYAKTLGNPLFLTQILRSLVDDKIISFSLAQSRWVWNISEVKTTSIDDSVVLLMTRKLKSLPEDTQKALKTISCFGIKVGESLLQILLAGEHFREMIPCLNIARKEGILEWDGDNQSYRFAHDLLQQATYCMMSKEEKRETHFAIGVHLITCLRGSHLFNPVVFSAADQINIAMSLGHQVEKTLCLEFASLNLKAGERSMEVGDFVSALNYFQNAISFLPPDRWDHNYELSLRLFESSCLACYINARRHLMMKFLEEVLQHARTFDDKLKAMFVLVQSLTSSGKINDSLGKVFGILEELGETFPEEVTPAEIKDALLATRTELQGYTKEVLICAPRLNNRRLHWAMKLMAYAFPYIYMIKPRLMSLIACRMINISTKSGWCSEAAFALHSYGFCLVATLGDIEGGYQICKIAAAFYESCSAKNLLPKLKILSYHMSLFWVEPIQSTAQALMQCHREALLVGDNEYASFAGSFYCAQSIVCGANLPMMEKECGFLALKLIDLGQLPMCINHLTNHQCVLKLIGSTNNPFQVLPDGFMRNEDEVLQHALATKRFPLVQNICFNRAFVAFFFRRYRESAEYLIQFDEMTRTGILKDTWTGILKDVYHAFYQGLTAFHFVRHPSEDVGEEKKMMDIGEEALSSFRKWCLHSSWNWENKLFLLEAEGHFSQGNMSMAEEKYKAAIESAGKHRFVHEEGLSNELFASFHTVNGDLEAAKSHILAARTCYEKWGALALVQLLDSGI